MFCSYQSWRVIRALPVGASQWFFAYSRGTMVDQRLLAARETGEASLRSPRTSRLRSLTGPPTKRGRKKKTTSTPADVSSPRKVDSPSLLSSPVSPRSPRLFQHFRSSKTPKQVRRSSVDTVDTAETDTAVGVVGWLRDQCPDDVLPKVLAFCAPSTAAALKRTCRYFYDILNQEETWKVLCEEHYKVCCYENPSTTKAFFSPRSTVDSGSRDAIFLV